MERDRETDFSFDEKEVATLPSCLCGKIVKRIRTEKKLEAARRKTMCFTVALVGSAIAFLAAFFALEGALIQSEFLKLASLLFSDPATIAADWVDFGSFFLESLPVIYLSIFLASLFALLELLKYAAKYASDTLSLSKLVKG